jgi:hypothetical protein
VRITPAEAEGRINKRPNIASLSAVIDDSRTDCKLAIYNRRRRRCDARLLNVDDDVGVDIVGVVRPIAKANDIELRWRE